MAAGVIVRVVDLPARHRRRTVRGADVGADQDRATLDVGAGHRRPCAGARRRRRQRPCAGSMERRHPVAKVGDS
jgi:hypothetical protein